MHIYHIPIIQSDLRHEETIIQAINSLEYLQNVITSVFERINTRIESNTTRIEGINKRILKANSQVENLIGINKAINIFSSPKYPAAKVFKNVELTFANSSTHNYNVQVNIIDDCFIKNSLDPINQKNMQGKLQFYHVKGKNEPKIKLNKILSPPVGLGKLPLNIKSVNSLLIFNTVQNPYECYNQIDPLLNNDERKKLALKIISSHNELDAAPFSITHRKSIALKQDFLLYTPSVKDAPELDLPVDLPDLPGVVDDVVFNLSELDISIRPSKRKGVPALELPDMDEIIPNISPTPALPPIIPTEVIDVETITKPNRNVSRPPPPPPPPLPSIILENKDNISSTNKLEKNSTSSSDIRSNLMEAIRKAGGRAARVVFDDVVPNTSIKHDDSKLIKTPGDLMSDLHNKLAARRKGISGLQHENNVASSISSMIPPPAIKLNSSQSNTEASDEDWD